MDEKMITMISKNERKLLLAKWLKILLNIHLLNIVCSLITAIPGIESFAGLITTAVSAAAAYVLFRLSEACERYRKAAIFQIIAVVGTLLNQSVLSLLISICSIVGMYHEYCAHGEVTADCAPELSGKWHSLFNIQLIVGIISAFVSSAGVVIGVLAQMDTAVLVGTVVLVLALISLGLNIMYLVYLNQTQKEFMD